MTSLYQCPATTVPAVTSHLNSKRARPRTSEKALLRNLRTTERIDFMSGVGGTRRSMWQLSPAFCDGALFVVGAASFVEGPLRNLWELSLWELADLP
jgi:hypothetical protein